MTNLDICNAAITLCGEVPATATADYSSRSFTLLALIYNQCLPLDNAYRASHAMEPCSWTPGVLIDPTEDFPLSEVFISAVSYALGALLVTDENSELSNLFYSRYLAGLDEIRRLIPAAPGPIVDCYHLF